MALGDWRVETIQASDGTLYRVSPCAVEPVTDIAALAAAPGRRASLRARRRSRARRQIAGWDDAQAVIAELAGATSPYRTAQSIAQRTHLPVNFVTAVLDQLRDDQTAGPARVWKDEWGYSLFTRRSGFIKRSAPVRWFQRRWNKPTVD